MPARFVSLLCLALPLLACGDRVPTGVWALGPGESAAAPRAGQSVLDTAFTVEIDDGVMAELLDVHRRVLRAGGDVRRAVAATTSNGWDREFYGRALVKWEVMRKAAHNGTGEAQRNLAQLDEQLEGLKVEQATATGPERERVTQMIQQVSTLRARYSMGVAGIEKLATPEVAAFVAKWEPRFEALEAEFDEE